MKKLILTLVSTFALLAGANAYTVKLGGFLRIGDYFVNSNTTNTFNGHIVFGSFNGTAPNFTSDSQSTLWTKFRPWAVDLTVLQSGVEDWDGAITGTAANPTPVTNGTFSDITAGASANIGNTNLATSFYNNYALSPVFAWVANPTDPTSSTDWSSSTAYSIFQLAYTWIATPNVALGLPTNVQVSTDTLDLSVLVRDGGVQLVPEPSAALLTLAGGGLMALRRRRRS